MSKLTVYHLPHGFWFEPLGALVGGGMLETGVLAARTPDTGAAVMDQPGGLAGRSASAKPDKKLSWVSPQTEI